MRGSGNEVQRESASVVNCRGEAAALPQARAGRCRPQRVSGRGTVRGVRGVQTVRRGGGGCVWGAAWQGVGSGGSCKEGQQETTGTAMQSMRVFLSKMELCSA